MSEEFPKPLTEAERILLEKELEETERKKAELAIAQGCMDGKAESSKE